MSNLLGSMVRMKLKNWNRRRRRGGWLTVHFTLRYRFPAPGFSTFPYRPLSKERLFRSGDIIPRLSQTRKNPGAGGPNPDFDVILRQSRMVFISP